MIQRHGWNLLFHQCLSEQLQKLHAADQRARHQDPQGFESNANVRLFEALSKLIFNAVPSDPNREEYRQGHTMGNAFRHWRRAKIGRRFRLFFRFDSKTRIIIFAWVNAPNGQTWDDFFMHGSSVSEEFLTERAFQKLPEREVL